MSQIFRPNGLSIANYNGGKPRQATFDFPINSGTAFSFGSGDPVAFQTGSITEVLPATAYPPTTGEGAQMVLGVWQSVQYQPSQSNVPPATSPYWVSGTTTRNSAPGMASINIQPNQFYIIQANDVMNQVNILSNYNLTGFNGASSANNYTSTVSLQASGGTSQNYAHAKVVGLAPIMPWMQDLGGNAWGDPYPWVIIMLNNTNLHYGTYAESI